MYVLARAKTVPNAYAGIAVVEGCALPPDQTGRRIAEVVGHKIRLSNRCRRRCKYPLAEDIQPKRAALQCCEYEIFALLALEDWSDTRHYEMGNDDCARLMGLGWTKHQAPTYLSDRLFNADAPAAGVDSAYPQRGCLTETQAGPPEKPDRAS